MDEFNNNGQQGYNENLYGQPSQNFNDQPSQFGTDANMYGGQPEYNQYDPNMNQPQESKGLSIAALSVGILSLLTSCCGCVGLLVSIVAIVLGIIGRPKGGKGMATAGIICGAIGLILCVILTILSFSIYSTEFYY